MVIKPGDRMRHLRERIEQEENLALSLGTPNNRRPGNGKEPAKETQEELQSSRFTTLLWTWRQSPRVGFSLSISGAIRDWVGKSAYPGFNIRKPTFATHPNHVLQTNLVTKLMFWSPLPEYNFSILFRTLKKKKKATPGIQKLLWRPQQGHTFY